MEAVKQKHPIFNGQWEVLQSLGEGNTSKVYMARNIETKQVAALKLLRNEFLQRDEESIKSVESEIQILQNLKHDNIIQILSYGSDGHIKKPSGREIPNLVYLLLEFVSGGLLFDVCQSLGGMGEDGGRFFMQQMLDVLSYMHGKGVVHRDLKLENILVDDAMNLKVADFGFATFKNIHKLKSYRGTMTYMAPEIKTLKNGQSYDGMQIDLFSTAVILFIIVQGIFPFKEAKKDCYFYNLILKGDLNTYWQKTGGESLSPEFKELIISMFNPDGSQRPTIDQLKAHPWVTGGKADLKQVRQSILGELQEKRSQSTNVTSREDVEVRGEGLLDLIKQKSVLQVARFNDLTDFDIDVAPGVIMDDLQVYNNEVAEGQWKLDHVEGKHILITIPKMDADENDVLVKIKFFQLGDDQRLRVRFVRKTGSMQQWHEAFNQLREVQMKDILLQPQVPNLVE